MRRISIVLTIYIILASCLFISINSYFDRDYTEQEIRSEQLVTYVWSEGEIVKSWYDPLEKVNKEFARRRKEQAEKYLKEFQELKESIDL